MYLTTSTQVDKSAVLNYVVIVIAPTSCLH